MTIIGVGVDIIDIRRIEALYTEHGDHFLTKFFNKDEIVQLQEFKTKCTDDRKFMQKIANTWAAKESVIKAYKGKIGMSDVNIFRDEDGAPYAKVKNTSWWSKMTHTIEISMSDEYPYSVAYCVITQG